MQTIKEAAQQYEPKVTKNIADLEKVDVNMNIEDRDGVGSEGAYKYKVAVIDGQDYRVPLKVLGDLKQVLSTKPELKTFKVIKNGQGMNTTYTLVPLD